MMVKHDVIVVGGGLAGLTCALALAKTGKSVLVLEKCHQMGGAFQSFNRRGQRLDTGFHYVGGIGEGEVMRPLIEFFELTDLPWQPLGDPFLEVFVHGQKFVLPHRHDAFVEYLSSLFPQDRRAVQELADMMREINNHLYERVLPDTNFQSNNQMIVSAKAYLESHISSPVLRDLLCGQCLTTELTDNLPLYSFIQSLNSFIQGAYRLKGGGETLIHRLMEKLADNGGEMLTCKTVHEFTLREDGQIRSVVCTDGSEYVADTFISTLHPTLTMECLPECPQIRKIYRRRMRNLENTVGMFTVQLSIRPGTVPYRDCSVSILESEDVWNTPCGKGSRVQTMLVNYNVPNEGNYATNIDLLTPMDWEAVREWEESSLGHRPDTYKAFKREKAEECIALAKRYIPELQDNIIEYWTSSPLTYRDYTSTPHGSSYGVRKSCNNLLNTIISPATPFANLFLSGQSLTLHGMLGTTMTSILTCNLICGRNILEG